MNPLIVTTGEPAGIGPDICVQLAAYLAEQPVVLCGDIDLLRQRAQLHGKDIAFYHALQPRPQTVAPAIAVRHTPCFSRVKAGQLDVNNSPYVLDMLEIAAKDTLAGQYAGIVTAPVHKGILCEAGEHFSGHTEFFAEKTGAALPVMVLGTATLKVGLVTTHLPLKDVPAAVTSTRLRDILTIIDADMRRYFTEGRPPRIGVCGLNPHAGEDGHLGCEEIEVINPTLDALRAEGVDVSSALPADTLLVPQHAAAYDIIVAMYHDQGLPVVKAQGFGACVNMTFGLPIIRTSVDHGTALNLAGTAQADAGSLQCAIEMALQMASCTAA
ncbi:MAG: 4-hydroxythreonine-4-phosphate dehydrogenase PdxA [Gammaproteobacteria bacterium]|nr:MAG: 4-hydroxythreonine-4-phosphate dehydrogenase PdxA [Gammaproteobacteria bacterium]